MNLKLEMKPYPQFQPKEDVLLAICLKNNYPETTETILTIKEENLHYARYQRRRFCDQCLTEKSFFWREINLGLYGMQGWFSPYISFWRYATEKEIRFIKEIRFNNEGIHFLRDENEYYP